MRVNIDEKALAEPRIKRMARSLTGKLGRPVHHFEVLGRLTAVWMLCYSRRDPVIRVDDVDITSEIEGFAEVMVAEEMATATEGEQRVYVCGVAERIAFLERQTERGRKGGKAPRETEAMAMQARLFADDEALAKRVHERTLARAQAKAERSPSVGQANSPAPDQALTPAPDQDHPPRPGSGVEQQSGADLNGEPATNAQESAERVGPTESAGAGSERAERKPAREVPDQAVTLAQLLLDSITTNHPSSRIAKAAERTRGEAVMRWAATIDKMHRLDRIEWGTIQGMITWCQRDSFWRGVILGADNLRDKWDTMLAQRNRPRDAHPNAPRGAPSFDQVLDDAARDINAKRNATDKEQPT